MALSKKGKKNKKLRTAAKRAEKRKKQEAKSEERKADRVARGLPAVTPKPPKKRTTWSGESAPLPPPQLIDRIHEWLRDYRYVKAAHGVRTDNQKRPGHNMMIWKGTSNGLPQLNEIFFQWKEQNPELAMATHEKETTGQAESNSDSDSSEDDSDSDSDSDSDDDEEMKDAFVALPSVAVNAGTKRKAEEMSSDDTDSDSSDSSSESSDEDEVDEEEDNVIANEVFAQAAASTAITSDSSATVGRKSPDAPTVTATTDTKADGDDVDDDSSSESSTSESESSESDSDSDSEADASKANGVPIAANTKKESADADTSDSDSDSESDSASDSDTSTSTSSSSESDAPAPPKKARSEKKKASADPAPTQTSTLTDGAPAAKRARPDKDAATKPFSRIPEDVAVDPRFSSNAYVPYNYAEKAHADLIVTKGRGFTKEKNKKKRGQGFRGGQIDMTSRGIKFDD